MGKYLKNMQKANCLGTYLQTQLWETIFHRWERMKYFLQRVNKINLVQNIQPSMKE